MSAAEEETNPYGLLNIKQESTEQEIKTAYRQKSLKVHPDRNPNNPDAARKFHELNQAYELLLDPLRRLALDAKLRIKQARAERFKSYDNKRKDLVEELELRERAFKKARVDKQKEEAETWHANIKIQAEGKRLREKREKELRLKMEVVSKQEQEDPSDEDVPPPMDPLDTTVRIKFPLKMYSNLNTPQAISALLARFGQSDESSIVISTNLQGKKDKPDRVAKTGSALVPFKQIGDAFAAVCASERKDLGLDGIKISWVRGEEPAILEWLRKIGKLSRPHSATASGDQNQTSGPNFSLPSAGDGIKAELPQNQVKNFSIPFSSFPSSFPEGLSSRPPKATKAAVPGLDYEALTLMRLRQAERERLEKEILEQEAKET